jgi:hypothetical protein
VTASQRVAEWTYYVEHYRAERDRCTNTPAGRRLREILRLTLAACEVELEAARAALPGEEGTT